MKADQKRTVYAAVLLLLGITALSVAKGVLLRADSSDYTRGFWDGLTTAVLLVGVFYISFSFFRYFLKSK